MGRFTRIPETNLPGTLGGIVGQAAGTVIGNANITLEKLQKKLNLLSEGIEKGIQVNSVELDRIEHTLDVLEKSILGVERSAEGLSTTIASVRVPIVALKVAINIAKYLPLPSPIASVSVLQADIIQMLLELVAQIEQTILTLEVIIKVILDLLKKIKELILKLRRYLTILKTRIFLQEDLDSSDKGLLEKTGLFGIFSPLTPVVIGRVSDIIWVGNYAEINTGSLAVENQVKSAESGTTITVYEPTSGFWNTYAYCISEKQPEKPVSTDLIPSGWKSGSSINSNRNIWQSKGLVSGKTGKVISWTIPVPCSKENVKVLSTMLHRGRDVNVFRYSYNRFKSTGFNLQEANAIVLTGPEEGYNLFLETLEVLDNLPISSKLKSKLQIDINPQEDQSVPDNEIDYYISTTGAVYTLKVRSSSVSPKIATLRYVEVTDESGTIVYEGTRTFATNTQVLLEETKVRLVQLFS